MLLNPFVAEYFYDQILNIINNHGIANRGKIVALYQTLDSILISLIENENISFTEFARLHYVINKHNIPRDVKIKIFSFRTLKNHIGKKQQYQSTDDSVRYYMQTLCELIYFLSDIIANQQLRQLFLDEREHIDHHCLAKVEKNTIHIWRGIFLKKDKSSNNLLCLDEDNHNINIEVSDKNLPMLNMLWKKAMIIATNLEFVEIKTEDILTRIHNKDIDEAEEIENKHTLYYYKATSKTNFIIEPDYLIDVTEVVDCFNMKNEFPLIPVVNKFIVRDAGSAAFKGNIINSFFDELVSNCEIDFETALKNAIIKKPLQMLVYIKELDEKGLRFSDYSHFSIFFRGELYDSFDNLRSIVIKHFFKTENFVEPSFISSTYGLQGRLDLLAIDYNNNINIVELKSGKAPNEHVRTTIGIAEKRELLLPLWINHYIQIISYNLLIMQAFPARIGTSSILYSKISEKSPVRSVVDNSFVQSEILTMRNWLVAFMKELSLGNTNIFKNINEQQLSLFPPYSQYAVRDFVEKIKNLNECEAEYFKAQVAFISKEIFSNKLGLYSNGMQSGFSGLWLHSAEEKKQKNIAIFGLTLDIEQSDFSLMHLVFSRKNECRVTPFRKNDICIVYKFTENESPINQQLLRGRIMHIDENKLIISLRNKLSQNFFDNNNEWVLEADYIETMNKHSYSSLTEFITSNLENKNYILGKLEPQFSFEESVNIAIENLSDIGDDKKNILKSAIASQNYFLIQGPPGTGKTKYILRYLIQLLRSIKNEVILIIAFTNRAVDEICASINLISPDFDFIRLGNHDSSEHRSNLISNIPLNDLSEKITNTNVFVSTVASIAMNPELFQLKNFDSIIVDEATQILEREIVGLLLKSRRFIMIGDEKQLPAVTTLAKSELHIESEYLLEIELTNLRDSLFERLLRICKKNNWPAYAQLEEQSRMSPEIMKLANEMFYDNKLKLNPNKCFNQPESVLLTDVHNYNENSLQTLIENQHFIFINSPVEAHNKMNINEVDTIMNIISFLELKYGEHFNANTLGIISPWRMQCTEISKRLSHKQRQLIAVDTVERFQGSEREIIIYSTATNSVFLMNLLSEIKLIDGTEVDRKLNVSITRAKQKFIILGNRQILSQSKIYRKLLNAITNE